MEEKRRCPRYPTNWSTRFLCNCRKNGPGIDIHHGVAKDLSACGMRLQSDHNVCQEKKVAMQLLIPSMLNGAQKNIVKIIGRSLSTVASDGTFHTRIEFLHFEEDGKKVLESNLSLRFNNLFSIQTEQGVGA